MKILNESKFYIGESECAIKLYLKEHFQGDEVDFEDYYFKILIPNEIKLANDETYAQIINEMTSTFLNLQGEKHALYIPTDRSEFNAYGEGFIDVFYPTDVMQPTDAPFITDDNEVAKNIIYTTCDYTDKHKLITVNTPSLITINQHNQFNTIWDLNNCVVYKFLKEELEEF